MMKQLFIVFLFYVFTFANARAKSNVLIYDEIATLNICTTQTGLGFAQEDRTMVKDKIYGLRIELSNGNPIIHNFFLISSSGETYPIELFQTNYENKRPYNEIEFGKLITVNSIYTKISGEGGCGVNLIRISKLVKQGE